MSDLPGTHPGCLVASLTYESQQFDDQIRSLNAEGVLSWRGLFMEYLKAIVEKHPPHMDLSLEELADMLTSVIEGGIILSKALSDPEILPRRLLQYRNYIRFVFGTH